MGDVCWCSQTILLSNTHESRELFFVEGVGGGGGGVVCPYGKTIWRHIALTCKQPSSRDDVFICHSITNVKNYSESTKTSPPLNLFVRIKIKTSVVSE